MGSDKAAATVGGVAMGTLAGRALVGAARPVLAVGPDPGLGLGSIGDPRRGPLAALVAGMGALARSGCGGPVLVVACDLPFLTPSLLSYLASQLGPGAARAVVPLSGGRRQPLCACYSAGVLAVAEDLVAGDRRAMRDLLDRVEVTEISQPAWRRYAGAGALTDVDTPEDLLAANTTPTEAGI